MAAQRFLMFAAIGVAGVEAALAERAWDERLAHRLSSRLGEIERELAAVEAALPALPGLPIDDQGGTGGFARLNLKGEGRFSVTVTWSEPAPAELIALVPPRRYDVDGLEPQYGTPDAFSVDLLDAAGSVVARVAEFRGVRADPVRAGHPFVIEVDPPVVARSLRVTAQRLPRDPDRDGNFVHGWAEAFVFSGNRNLAAEASVSAEMGSYPASIWHWSDGFLVDGQTPLGLPELPAGEHRDVGWLSEARRSADERTWLEVDLGSRRSFDALRLFPAKRLTSDLPAGFGFPRAMRITVADRDDGSGAEVVAEGEIGNPGHNPTTIPLGACEGRYVRIEATELWKEFDRYPAFFALSEVEVLSGGENVALGAAARSPYGMGNLIASGTGSWSPAALCDGFGPDGRLVPTREWLVALDGRLQLERKRHRLSTEAERIVADWRRAGLTGFAVLGGAGAFALIALPVRYRVRARKDLRKVRERIAGDLHDEVGSNLGSIQMFADLAEGRAGPSDELKRIQRIAAETVSAVRDIVWLLRPHGGARIGTVEHLRETASIMLEPLEWEFTANEPAWETELPDEASRHLFLFFREALHNILRHARAERVTLRAERAGGRFVLRIADDGAGIPEAKRERSSTLRALRQRAEALGAEFRVESSAEAGTRLELEVPLERKRRGIA